MSEEEEHVKSEALVRLYVMLDDAVCTHILDYIRNHDAQRFFHVVNVETLQNRPSWLRGVPTVVFRTELKGGVFTQPQALSGEKALYFIRDTTEGSFGSCYDEDELEVCGKGGGAKSSVSTCDFREPTPDDDEDDDAMLQRILRIPRVHANGKECVITADDIKKAMEARDAALND